MEAQHSLTCKSKKHTHTQKKYWVSCDFSSYIRICTSGCDGEPSHLYHSIPQKSRQVGKAMYPSTLQIKPQYNKNTLASDVNKKQSGYQSIKIIKSSITC